MTSYHNDQCRSRNKPESLSWTLPPLLSLILFLDPDVLKAKTKILHQVQMQSLKKAARLKKRGDRKNEILSFRKSHFDSCGQ